jgi:hypothetical protein
MFRIRTKNGLNLYCIEPAGVRTLSANPSFLELFLGFRVQIIVGPVGFEPMSCGTHNHFRRQPPRDDLTVLLTCENSCQEPLFRSRQILPIPSLSRGP